MLGKVKKLVKAAREDPLLGKGRQVKSSKEKKKASPYMKAINDLSDHYNQKHKHLLGELLTTLEATVDDERKLEALRTRVKDTQSLTWEEMNQELWGSFDWFDKDSRSPTDLKALANKTIHSHLTHYSDTLQTLVKAVFTDQQRATALNKEISRLVHKTRVSIQRALHQIMASAFSGSEKPEE